MGLDWRIYLGLGLTALWLLLGVLYLSTTIGWASFVLLPVDQMGSFLEGAFAPLAFLWLVIGYFLQQEELQQNTAALKAQALEIERTAIQATIQSEKLADSEVHARQEAFLRIAQSVRSQLGTIAGMLYISSQGAAAPDGTITREEQSALFAKLSMNDTEVFSRRLLELNLSISDPKQRMDLFYGTEVRARHSNNFIITFERMIRRARAVDTENMITDSLLASSHGLIWVIMQGYQELAPDHLANPEKTGTGLRL